MARHRLTAKFVENVRPGSARQEIPDGTGLYLVLQASGRRSWAVRYRINGKPTKLTLGAWPAVSLHDARVAAAEALKQVRLGTDPARTKADAAAKAAEAKLNTVANICAEYMKREGHKLRTADARGSILRRLVFPTIGGRPIDTVKRSEIVRLLDKVEDDSGPRMADVCLGVLRRIFHWHEKRSDEFRSPIIRGMARQKASEHRRDRILTDDEIRAVWAATADGSTFSALVRFLLLSGCRRGEAAGMKRDEVDPDGVWTLPASRSKTKTEIIRPLSKAALEVLAGQPQIDGCDYVFASATGRTPVVQFSASKAKLDAASGVTGWKIHDARRTSRSLLSRCKDVTVDLAERVLGHARPDLIARYDRHDYIEEMRFAVESLSALISTIVNPPAADVADIAVEKARRQRRRR